jgi:two-component system chemotaxis sensor kinase CheA
LAIISALLVGIADRTYAIPLSSIVESIRFATDQIHHINGRDTLRLRDRIVPLVYLADVYNLQRSDGGDRRYAVVLGRGDKQIGLVVDGLKGQQEVVIKALDPSITGAATAIAGATIMGDGSVVLIVDVPALFEGRRHALVRDRGETHTAA